MNLLSFDDFLLESKQVGLLYHFTNDENALKILSDNELRTTHGHKGKERAAFFTRNKMYLDEPASTGMHRNLVRFCINGDKLSNNYKISPSHNLTRGYEPKPHGTGKYNKDEFEESVDKNITDIKKYIIDITLDKVSLQKIFAFSHFTTSTNDPEQMIKDAETKAQKEMKEFYYKLQKFGIPVKIEKLTKEFDH